MSGDGLTPTEGVQTFVGLAFHADPRYVDAKRLGQARPDLQNERCDFRSLEHDRHVHVLDRKALSGDAGHRVAKERDARGILPPRVRIGIMLTDVARACRTEHGIDDGMAYDV